MESTPTGFGSDLRTILGFVENVRNSKYVKSVFQQLDLEYNSRTLVFVQPKLRPVYCPAISVPLVSLSVPKTNPLQDASSSQMA